MSLTLATQITLLRILCAPLFAFLLIKEQHGWAMLVFGLASLTDTFDGLIARKFGQKSEIGALLDPVADKVLLVTAFVALSIPFLALANPIPLWLTITTIARDALITIGALLIRTFKGPRTFPPTVYGKMTTTFQMLTVCVSLLGNYLLEHWFIFDLLVYTTMILTVVSGLQYLQRGIMVLKSAQEAPWNRSRGANRCL